jgi:hypothetical protein
MAWYNKCTIQQKNTMRKITHLEIQKNNTTFCCNITSSKAHISITQDTGYRIHMVHHPAERELGCASRTRIWGGGEPALQ